MDCDGKEAERLETFMENAMAARARFGAAMKKTGQSCTSPGTIFSVHFTLQRFLHRKKKEGHP
jgi:hypothetical protein